MSKQRIEYIDIVKGLAILLVIIGHSYSEDNGEYIVRWIYSFHMPLFFLTTGILYGMKKHVRVNFNIFKKAKQLLWPYLFWGTMYLIFLSVLKIIGGASIVETLYKHLTNILIISGSSMWFLPTMFLSLVFFWLIFHFASYNKVINSVCAIIIMSLGILLPTDNELLRVLLRVFVGTGYIMIGFIFVRIYNKEFSQWLLLILTTAHLIVAMLNTNVSLMICQYGNPFMYVSSGCLGTLVVYGWAKKVKVDSKLGILLRFWGRNSLKILCLHGFVVQVIRLIDYKIFGDLLPVLGWGEGFVFSIFIMVILTLVLMKKNTLVDWTFGV